MLKRVLFIVNMEEENKAGLFTATHQRVKGIKEHLNKLQVYSLRYYDGLFVRLVKKLLNKKIYYKTKKEFIYDGVTYRYLYLRTSVFQKLFPNVSLILFIIFYTLIHQKQLKKFDLISAHWGHPQGYFAYWLNKFLRIPYVITLHGSDIHTIPHKNKIVKKLTLRSLRDSKHNFFVSKNLWSSAYELGYKENNYSVLYNGIDISKFTPLSKNKKKKCKSDLNLYGQVVGFIGNLIEIKRADKLGEIFNRIQLGFDQDVTFLVVGDGELKEQLKNQCNQYGVTVNFVGKVLPEKVIDYINAMDILILPSKKEGFGRVILEANSCGVLALGSSNGGIPEAIGNIEYVVNDVDKFEELFANRVIKFLEEGYNQTNLINRIQENFSSEKIIKKEIEIYEDIIEKNK